MIAKRDQLAAVSEQRDALEAEVAELRDAVEMWRDPAYVRAQARERLNYVRPGVVGLIVLGTESTAPSEAESGVAPWRDRDESSCHAATRASQTSASSAGLRSPSSLAVARSKVVMPLILPNRLRVGIAGRCPPSRRRG